MANLILTVLIGVLGGVAVGVQGPIVSQMSQRIGTMAGSFCRARQRRDFIWGAIAGARRREHSELAQSFLVYVPLRKFWSYFIFDS